MHQRIHQEVLLGEQLCDQLAGLILTVRAVRNDDHHGVQQAVIAALTVAARIHV